MNLGEAQRIACPALAGGRIQKREPRAIAWGFRAYLN
jgi:hypothetical protein